MYFHTHWCRVGVKKVSFARDAVYCLGWADDVFGIVINLSVITGLSKQRWISDGNCRRRRLPTTSLQQTMKDVGENSNQRTKVRVSGAVGISGRQQYHNYDGCGVTAEQNI